MGADVVSPNDKYRALFEASLDAIFFAKGATGLITDVNDAACRLIGRSREELIGMRQEELHPADERERYRNDFLDHLSSGGGFSQSLEVVRANGERVPVEISSSGFEIEGEKYLFAIFRDLSERQRYENQLRHAQKMELIGQLAGGMAHDFNNLLMGISGCCEIALRRLPHESSAREPLLQCLVAITRGASVTKKLLAFTRRDPSHKELVSLNKFIDRSADLLRLMLGETIQLQLRLEAPKDQVRVGAGDLDQVMMNLTQNARDAMPQGGSLAIETELVELDAAAAARVGLPPGQYVSLTFLDVGQGMDDATLAKAGEPFFSTKSPDRGTGMGLATVRTIVTDLRGGMDISSKVAEGTRVTIYLPQCGRSRSSIPGRSAESGTRDVKVLVVEDEPLVRMTVEHYLGEIGCAAVSASTPQEALTLCEQEEFDLLLTDLMMPEMSGEELAQHASALLPRLKVAFMSAYSRSDLERRGLLRGCAPLLLEKPFNQDSLTKLVLKAFEKSN